MREKALCGKKNRPRRGPYPKVKVKVTANDAESQDALLRRLAQHAGNGVG